MQCLVIDDDESPRQLMVALLTRSGYQVTAAEDGSEAMTSAQSNHFDVAIVDMELPGMDGASIIAKLRDLEPEIRVLAVSGHADRRYVLSALESGAVGYLLKDDVGEFLSAALSDVQAGYTVLSPRIHTSTLRQLLRVLGRPVVEARSEPRSRNDLEPIKP